MIITPEEPANGWAGYVDRLRAVLSAVPGDQVRIQLRRKNIDDRELLRNAEELRQLATEASVDLVINSRPDIAFLVGAGVHLPETGVAPADTRQIVGADRSIGRSIHDRAGMLRAQREGADYAVLSTFADSPGKGPPISLEEFRQLTSKIQIPVYALGGIDERNAAAAIEAGAAGIAVIRAIDHAEDPGGAARRLLRALVRGSGEG